MDEMQEILEEFYIEAEESLEELESDLVKLEALAEESGTDFELVNRVFRVLHTLKGGAGFLNLTAMTTIAHAGETLLDEVRSGNVEITKDVMDALLRTMDYLKEMLDIHRDGGEMESVEVGDIADVLKALAVPGGAAPKAAEPAPVEEAPVVETPAEPVAETPAPVAGGDVNQELLAEIQADDRLGGDLDTGEDEPVSPIAASSGSPAINEDLLAEINADDRLGGDPVAEEAAPDAPAVNEDLLAEINADDRLGGEPIVENEAKDELLAEIVADDRLGGEPEAEEPVTVESAVNEDLLAEINADDRLGGEPVVENEAKDELLAEIVADDRLGGDAAEEVEVVEAEPVKAEDTPATAAPAEEIKRGEAKPFERRAEDRRQGTDERRKGGRRQVETRETTIRVETGRLDSVMNLVGELVLARNSLIRQLADQETHTKIASCKNYPVIQSSMELLSRVTKDLQMSVLRTRMQPIKKVFDKIPRQVRELKSQLGREVNLIVEGEMTEVDKTLVEELSDPMVHMIRNALDHGIESPEDRKAVGKAPEGTLSIRAFYEGNNVVIQVAEDGKGINPEGIKAAAVKKGVIDEDKAFSMSDEDAQRLIFAPGFSTAETLSDVSGRGVGMDVVNSKISAIKGTIDVTSEVGVGTTFSIYLPLTLAIVQALVVKTNNEGFAIPISTISEVVKFVPEDVHKVNEREVIEMRGEVLPLFNLAKLTKSGESRRLSEYLLSEVSNEVADVVAESQAVADNVDESQAVAASLQSEEEIDARTALDDLQHEHGYIVIVREGTMSIGVVVDQLIGQEEAVVKSITEMFEYNPAISGATITGDGTVHMILDVSFLMRDLSKKNAA